MIRFPTAPGEVSAAGGTVRAGGTDLTERRRLGLATGDLVDLRDIAGLDTIARAGTGVTIGAMVRLATLAKHPLVAEGYPALSAAAGGLATPQIRAVATLGGSLLQRSRCWYYRAPEIQCLKKGGSACYAKKGDHLYHACFDLGPCVAVHPSTLGMALYAYDATVSVHATPDRSIADLFGDGSDPRREHTLRAGELLTAVHLPARVSGERSAYFRAISRAFSEWPLVECTARLVVEGGRVTMARIAVGGVAPVPLRLPKVEAALEGGAAKSEAYAAAAERAREGTAPLPMTGYKVDLLVATVLETIERAHHGTPVASGAGPAPGEPTPTESDPEAPTATPP